MSFYPLHRNDAVLLVNMVARQQVALHDALHGGVFGKLRKVALVSGQSKKKGEHTVVTGVGRAVDKFGLEGEDVGVGGKVHAMLGVKQPGMAMEEIRLIVREGALMDRQGIAKGGIDVFS